MTTAPSLPAGPQSSFPGHLLLQLSRDPTGFLLATAREFGPIARWQVGRRQIFLLSDPELIHDVLVVHHRRFMKGQGLQVAKRVVGEGILTSEGSFWLRQRRMMQPAFHRARIAAYGATMVEQASRMSERWQAGTTVDIANEMMRLTLAIAAQTLFDVDVEGGDAQRIGQMLDTTVNSFNLLTMPIEGLLDRLPLPRTRRLKGAIASLDEIIYGMIRERRADPKLAERSDLLSMLLLAQDEEGDGGQMSDRQVRDEAMTIFLAGHETTATALTWIWSLLAEHPTVAQRLHAELDEVLGGRPPTVEDQPRLPYTRQVTLEAMRLYPPVWTLGRIALEPHPVRDDVVVPEGGVILMSQWVMHHDPRYFPDPFRFDPERWTPEAEAALPRFAYFPFGGGPRLCIGEAFARMELILLLATLAQQWAPVLAPGHSVAVQPRITLRPKGGMPMRLVRRG